MRRLLCAAAAALALAAAASGDVVQLVSGKQYQGAVIQWGPDGISFVPQGGAAGDAFAIPSNLIDMVVLPDGSEHKPGTGSWINTGRLERLPWEKPAFSKDSARGAPRTPVGLLAPASYVFRLTPFVGKQTGYTSYQISFPWTPDVGVSRLDYPLDAFAAGIKAAALSRPFGSSGWQLGFDAAFFATLTDPAQNMTDSDWVGLTATSTGTDRYVFSATTSTSKLSGLDVSIGARLLYPLASLLKAGGTIGYRYLRMMSDIYGVSGWQDPNLDYHVVYFSELQNTNVLDYRVSYHLPSLGAVLVSESDQGLTLECRAAYLFGASANDEDDHLLRNKKGTSSASGSGWALGGEARMRIATLKNGSRLELAGSYDYLTVDATGTQTQAYYGDDPGISGDQTGLSVSGITDKLFIRRHSFGAFVTYTF